MKVLPAVCRIVFCLSVAGCAAQENVPARPMVMSGPEMHAALSAAEDKCRKAGNGQEGEAVARAAADDLRGRIVELRDVIVNEVVPYEQAERWHDLETLAGQVWTIDGGCTAVLWEDPGYATHEEYSRQIFQDLGLHKPVAQAPEWWKEQPISVLEVVSPHSAGKRAYSVFVRTELLSDLRTGRKVTVRLEITDVLADRIFGRVVALESGGKDVVKQERAFPPLSHR